eukprot:g1035.t1
MGQSSSRTLPLLEAVFEGDERRTKQLLDLGCSPTETTTLKKFGEVSPILAAIQTDRLQILRLLLNKTRIANDINLTVGTRKLTALHIAASQGSDELTEALLSRGANICIQDVEGNTALMLAILNRKLSTIWVLCQNSSSVSDYIDLANNKGQTALHIACELADLALVSSLLKQGADPNLPMKTRGHKGHTPIVSAVLSGNHEVVSALLTAGSRVDIDIENRRGLTLLHLAVLFNYPKIVRLLMEHGVSIESGHTKGDTPMDLPTPVLLAAAYGRHDCFRELLNTSQGEIDHCIEKGGRIDLVAIVVEKIVGRVPETSEPPMAWAIQYPCQFINRSMTVLGFRGNMQFTSGVEHMTKGHFLCVELLLQAGAGITADQMLRLQQHLMHAKIIGKLDEDLKRLNATISGDIWECNKCGLFGLWPSRTDLQRFCSMHCSESSND